MTKKGESWVKDDGEPFKPIFSYYNKTPCDKDYCYTNIGQRCSDCLFTGKGKYEAKNNGKLNRKTEKRNNGCL